jgi:hypothetical protein
MLEEMRGHPGRWPMCVHLPSNRPGTLRLIEYDDDAGDVLTWRCLCRLYHWWAEHADDWKETR